MSTPPITIRATITNLVDNPAAATNTTGWQAGTSTTIERTASLPTTDGLPDGVTTGFSVTATQNRTASINGAAVDPIAVQAGVPHTLSVYVYIPASWTGGTILLRHTAFANSTGVNDIAAVMETRDAWQRLVLATFVADPGDVVGNVQIAVGNPWNIDESFLFTAVMAHPGTKAKPYFSGTIPARQAPGILAPGTPILPLTTH